MRAMSLHPELRAAWLLPRFSWGPRLAAAARRAVGPARSSFERVDVREATFPGYDGGPDVAARLLVPSGTTVGPAPALVWVHGGGHVFGTPEQDDRTNALLARTLGMTVAAVRYRLGADTPGPAAVHDVYAVLLGLVARSDELGLDSRRIAVGGASAGGGIAAGTVLLAHDLGAARPAFQLLVYPMLDDRVATRRLPRRDEHRVWTSRSNQFGWSEYLGGEPGADGVSEYLAPARRADLSGLPPAWIGVGDEDLFHDEDLAYATRLTAAGVPCTVEVVPGAFHGFDTLFPRTRVAQEFLASQVAALREGLSAVG